MRQSSRHQDRPPNGATYEMVAADRAGVGERPVTVVGKHCESGDILARDALLPNDLTAGDLVCSLVTGAPTATPWPARTTASAAPPSSSPPTATPRPCYAAKPPTT